MSATAVLTLLATVAQVDGGQLRIDKGLLDGLRTGDRGSIHYVLEVGAESRRIDIGEAAVAAVDERSAVLAPPEGNVTVRPGFLVEFRLPATRVAPEEILLTLAGHRLEQGRLREAVEHLDSWARLRAVVGDTPDASRRDAEAIALHEGLARRLLDGGDPAAAERQLLAIQRLEPGEPESLALLRWLQVTRMARMVRIPAGEYEIGADADAVFYNQRPRFRKRLETFWLDRSPASQAEFLLFRPDYVFAAGSGALATGVSYSEAEEFCRWRNGRLPTEFEWEVAAASGVVDVAQPVYEWTASWYLPYPGNSVPEEAYGRTVRVLRGRGDGDTVDVRLRRFLEPTERHSLVGFRCAGDAEPSPGAAPGG